jgi:hypothetical protein
MPHLEQCVGSLAGGMRSNRLKPIGPIDRAVSLTSGFGPKRTWSNALHMSAFRGNGDTANPDRCACERLEAVQFDRLSSIPDSCALADLSQMSA